MLAQSSKLPPVKNTTASPSKTKRKRIRAKTCVHCYTPTSLVTRCKIKAGGPWVFVCDLCWPTVCDGNSDYIFGGTWNHGKLIGEPTKPKAKADKSTAPKPPRFVKRGRRSTARILRREGDGGSRRLGE